MPIMLKAMGYAPPRRLSVHGFWNVEGQKMSKSLGNTISPLEMKEQIGMDAFRYFVLRESVFGQDADFRRDNLTARYNADLANNLGNYVSRVLAMQQKYFAGVVQPLGASWADEDGLQAPWGQGLARGHKINPPKNLFPRIETKK